MLFIGSQDNPDLYTNAEAVEVPIGGIKAGETFEEVPLVDMITRILYPYMGPQFTAFYIDGQATLLEVGDKIEAAEVDFNWAIAHPSNVEVDSINCNDITDSVAVLTGEANSGSVPVDLDEIEKLEATSHEWVIDATGIRGVVINRSFKVDWQWKLYYGESPLELLEDTDVQSLRVGQLAGNPSGTYNMEAGDYKWICYASSLGELTTFVDADTNFEVSMEDVQVVELVNDFGIVENYNCHRTYNTMGSDIKIRAS